MSNTRDRAKAALAMWQKLLLSKKNDVRTAGVVMDLLGYYNSLACGVAEAQQTVKIIKWDDENWGISDDDRATLMRMLIPVRFVTATTAVVMAMGYEIELKPDQFRIA